MKRAVLVCLVSAVGFMACDSSPTGPTLASLQPVGGTTGFSAVVGQPVPDSLTVRAINTAGQGVAGVEVRFEVIEGGGSISPNVVQTDANGLARAQWTLGTTAGPNTARASANGVEPVTFQATGRADTLHRVIVTPPVVDFYAFDQTAQLEVRGEDQYGNPVPTPNLSYRSLNPNVAGVFSDGVVVSRGLGTATIVATSRGIEGTMVVEVRQEPAFIEVQPDSVLINALTFERQFTVTVWDENRNVIQNPELTWTTADGSVATVDQNGVVTAVGVGATTLTVTSRGVSDTAGIRVRQVTHTVSVTPAVGAALEGETVQYSAVARDSAGVVIPDAQFTWSVTDQAVASVDQNGLATALRLGETGVRATSQGVHNTAELRVQQYPSMAAAGGHSCGLAASGQLHCWGFNSHGQLGTGNTISTATPTAVVGGHRFRDVQAGHRFTCAIGLTGDLFCWGSAERGQLGGGNFTNRNDPTRILAFSDIRQVSLGRDHACAVNESNEVYCWGANGQGQLGTGNYDDQNRPIRLAGLQLQSVDAGFFHTCGLNTDGEAWCWGENLFGQLGNGTGVSSPTPVQVSLAQPLRQVVSGAVHACALTAAGEAYCWGDNFYGQLGTGASGAGERSLVPVRAAPGRTFDRLESRGWYTCGIEANGTVHCWGDNEDGQLGSGSTAPIQPSPVTVSGGAFDYMTAGYFHSLGIRGQTAYAWGWNAYGQLGDGTTTSRSQPVTVQGWAPWGSVTAAGAGRMIPVAVDPATLEARIDERLRASRPGR
jgi:alpha-tubulin suppressor-like RCC1 family protein